MSQTIQNVGPGAVYAGLPAPSSLQQILPAYVYQQYADDDNVQAFFLAYNQMAQSYLDWVNATPLAIYTGSSIVGPLLDWVGINLYGIPRPVLSTFSEYNTGALDTQTINTLALNALNVVISGTATLVSDDIYKRAMTWNLYRGDGKQMSLSWLKRRVLRFVNGANGAPLALDQTNNCSVTFSGTAFSIVVATTPELGSTLDSLIQSGACLTPFEYTFTVTATPTIGSGLYSDGGVVVLVSPPDAYPTSPTGLTAGALYSNSGVICVAGTTTPATAPPIYFNTTTATYLLALGGANLPLMNPGVGSGELWNNGGVVSIA
jgi:hypothetical protein